MRRKERVQRLRRLVEGHVVERTMLVAIGDILRPLSDLRVSRKPCRMRRPQPILKALDLPARGIESVKPEPRLFPREPRGDVLAEVAPVDPAIERGGRLLQTGLEVERSWLRQPRLPERPPPDPCPVFVGQFDAAPELLGCSKRLLGCQGRARLRGRPLDGGCLSIVPGRRNSRCGFHSRLRWHRRWRRGCARGIHLDVAALGLLADQLVVFPYGQVLGAEGLFLGLANRADASKVNAEGLVIELDGPELPRRTVDEAKLAAISFHRVPLLSR